MQDRTTARISILLVLGTLLSSPLGAQRVTVDGERGGIASTVRVVVPAVIRVVVDSTQLDAAGLPMLRVISNVRALRALPAPTPEFLASPEFALAGGEATSGGANGAGKVSVVRPVVVRYTSALP